MKGKEKRKCLKEEKKNAGDDQKPAKKAKKNRFLAFLRGVWRRITGCTRVRPFSQQGSAEECPGPSNINVTDSRADLPPKEAKNNITREDGRRVEVERPKKLFENNKISPSLQSRKAIRTCWEEPQELQIPEEVESINSCTELEPVVLFCPSSQTSQCSSGQIGSGQIGSGQIGSCQSSSGYSSSGQSSSGQSSSSQSSSSQSSSSHSEERGASARLVEEPLATEPLSLDSFVFYNTLGEGGFGKVMLAEEKKSNTRVAIKMVEKWSSMSVEPLLTERNILQLSPMCPYLIHGLGTFNTENHLCYMMEFAARGDLASFIRIYHPFKNETTEFIMAELVCGVQFLHDNSILHRDLKPRNILLTAEGHIKISDFGLCKIGADLTAQEPYGTPGYAAPEVFEEQQYGPAADYYSLGTIFYELWTKEKAFQGLIYYDSFAQEPNDSLSNIWVDFLRGLLHEDPDQRLSGKYEVRSHPFFSNINWEDVDDFRLQPPKQILNTDYEDPDIIIKERREEIAKYREFFQNLNFEWSAHYYI